MPADTGHFNCRDYDVSLHSTKQSAEYTELKAFPHRHESYDDLERRSRSPASTQPRFPLLRLPLELRQQIYSYLIPRTQELKQVNPLESHVRNFSAVKKRQARGLVVPTANETAKVRESSPASPVIWIRGCTSLLGVCHQIHDEVAAMMYGNSTFLLFVTYSGITFSHRFMLPSGVAPTRSLPFLDMMPTKYLALIRKVTIHIDHVDSYTGMIKFNVSGKGLVHGLRKQVQKLVSALQPHTEIQVQDGLWALRPDDKILSKVIVRVSSSNAVLDTLKAASPKNNAPKHSNSDDVRQVLEPFQDLAGVRDVSITGAITSEFARELESKMRSTAPRIHHACCCQGGMADKDESLVRLCVYGNDID